MKVNADDAAKGNPGLVRAGGIVRDELGRWRSEGGFMENIGFPTSMGAELWALKLGLKLVCNLEFWRIILEVDSEVVVHAIKEEGVDMGCHGGTSR